MDQGKYAEAKPLFQRTLRIYEKALGPDRPFVATALNNLANLYMDQSKYAEVEPLFQRTLRIDEKALGPENPAVATRPLAFSVRYKPADFPQSGKPPFPAHMSMISSGNL